MRYWMSFVAAAVFVTLIMGCEWESSGSDGTWDDSYSWVDFSGFYRSAGGGILVAPVGQSQGSETNDIEVTDEVIDQTVEDDTTYNGTLANSSLVEGSLVISVSDWTLTDQGDGSLDGNDGTVGTIAYGTGVWSIDLGANVINAGDDIVASYTYESGGDSGQADSGTSGTPIYTFTVTQTGNKLDFTDNNGGTYSGSLNSLQTPGGDETGATSGSAVGNFEVEGTTVDGTSATIIGSFTAAYTASDVAGQTGNLGEKNMDASWIEDGAGGDIDATAE